VTENRPSCGGGRRVPPGVLISRQVCGARDLIPHQAQSPFIPTDAKIVVGAVAPASPDPIPMLPGFEYRMREWRHPQTHEVHWRLERRKTATYGDDD